MNDLWGDNFSEVSIKAPVVILREQAALLGQKTKGLILGKVSSRNAQSIEELSYNFSLVTPVLDNYTYGLFSISHPVAELYPVSFILENEIGREITSDKKNVNLHTSVYDVKAENEEEFLEILSQVLQSQKTTKILRSLKAQVIEPAI